LFKPLLKAYIRIAPFLTVGLIISLFIVLNQFTFVLLLLMIAANVGIHFMNKMKTLGYTPSLPQLLILYKVGRWLAINKLLEDNDSVNNSLNHVATLKRSLSFINFQSKIDSDPTDISFLISEWFKILLLLEPFMFIISIDRVNKYLADIKTLYEAVARVDMAISIQSVREGAAYYCKPQFSTGRDNIVIKDLYHPLIDNCVPNSITIDNKQGVLITGSNMSGKTTFIRAAAINSIVAQTINTSFAHEYCSPPLKILTSINMSDDLGESKSYFQAEALSIKTIIEDVIASQPINSLVIIDEIFRGTNTIERVAAAKAVLSYFIKNKGFVFVSTHDLELAELLGEDYKVFSFEEIMGDNQIIFDYKIKEGLLKNKNGIAVLQRLGYPESIIDEANKLSIQLRDKYNLS
jgi:DNA mismatch repair ATPase MutS